MRARRVPGVKAFNGVIADGNRKPMQKKATEVELKQLGQSENLSQLVRSNTEHYWHYMKAQADLGALEPFVKFEGMLAGDPHMGNFGVIPLTAKGGARRMRFVNIDFDDAG